MVWDRTQKLICLDCFLSSLIWLSFSFNAQWLDGIRHTELFWSVVFLGGFLCVCLCGFFGFVLFWVCFSFRNAANPRSKFNLENSVCLCSWIEKKKNQKTNPLLPIKKQIHTREKPFLLQHPGPFRRKKGRRLWLYTLWSLMNLNWQQTARTPLLRNKFQNISSVLRS